MIDKQPRATPPFPVAGHIARGEARPNPLAAELDAIAEGLRQCGDHEAADNLAEYGEYDYHGMARILNTYADRLTALAHQLKG